MEDRLKILAQWLQEVTTSDFGYDGCFSGRLESAIAESQVETCNKIGGYIEEILAMDSEQIDNELK
tara:strand:- start:370 stop:567 length:198 start_codon:yes stop_codon:yes gene_type:complete